MATVLFDSEVREIIDAQVQLAFELRRLANARLPEKERGGSTVAIIRPLTATGVLTRAFAMLARRILTFRPLEANRRQLHSKTVRELKSVAPGAAQVLSMVPDRPLALAR